MGVIVAPLRVGRTPITLFTRRISIGSGDNGSVITRGEEWSPIGPARPRLGLYVLKNAAGWEPVFRARRCVLFECRGKGVLPKSERQDTERRARECRLTRKMIRKVCRLR